MEKIDLADTVIYSVGVLVGMVMAFFGLVYLYLFGMIALDKKRVVENLKQQEDIVHLDYCGNNKKDNGYHFVYLDQDSLEKKLEEVTVSEFVEFISKYAQQNHVDTNQLVSVTFCDNCTLLPPNPDYQYGEVWEIKKSEYLIGFHFSRMFDSIQIRDKVKSMTFWNNGKQNIYRNDYYGRKLVNIDSIGHNSLKDFYRTN